MTRRELLAMIGACAGGAAMYQAMSSLGLAAPSGYKPLRLSSAPAGAKVLVLGAGIAGLVAAYELRRAGYEVEVLEYNARAGGRNWTLRGGDRYTELGGFAQECKFDPGLYFNPGPWRLPHHHRGMLDYCKRLGVKLEPFVQVNHNAYLHSSRAFEGKPQRFRAVKADYQGHVAELLAKATQSKQLDAQVAAEDQERLLESLREWGALDSSFRYTMNAASSERRGFQVDPGGGSGGKPVFSEPVSLSQVLGSGLWQALPLGEVYDMQTTLFQPAGGMDSVSKAFARELGPIIRYDAKVVSIDQDERAVSVAFEDARQPAARQIAHADWCVCTIPLSILGQIPLKVGTAMADAIAAVPYAASAKVGLQFKRRFWEEDEQIYGGITYTDLPITNIAYPSTDFLDQGKAVLLGGYFFGLEATRLTSLAPDERVMKAVEYGSQIHPQYKEEFENGISVAWHRAPFTLGCFALWSAQSHDAHYDDLCALDGRIVLAGEHASYLPGWQEGALLSSLDAIERLHRRAVSGGAAS
jgi:monoamine oxidase